MKKYVAGLIVLVYPFLASPSSANPDPEVPFISLTRSPVKKTQLPTNISVITEEDIERTGAKTVDEVLDQFPNIDLQRSGALGSFTTIRMRGATSSAQVQVVIDDMPLGGVSNQFVNLAHIPTENIARIEIVRGGSSVMYGANTIGGVIHIITKTYLGKHPYLRLDVEGRSHQTKIVKAQGGASGNGMDGFASVGFFETDGFQQNSDAKQKSGSTNIGYSFSNGARLQLHVSGVDHEGGNSQGTTIPIGEWDGKKERVAAEKTKRSEQDRVEGRFKAAVPLGEVGTVQSSFFGTDINFITRPRVGATPSFDQTNRIMGNDTRLKTAHGFTGGVGYERDEQETVGRPSSHITNLSGYVLQQIGKNRLIVTPGVRIDDHSQYGSEINPRVTAVVKANSKLDVTANVARSFRAPSFLNLFFTSAFFNGNPNLKPEIAWTYDLGARVRLPARHQLEMTGYYTKIRDRIFATPTTYINLNEAELSGVEVEMAGQIGPFRDRINWTYVRAKGNSGTSSAYVPLRLTPPHLVNGVLEYVSKKGFRLANTVQYVARQYRLNNNMGAKLPAYGLWHVRAEQKIKKIRVFAAVNNITNKRYAESFDFDPATFATTFNPAPDRTFWGGVIIEIPG